MSEPRNATVAEALRAGLAMHRAGRLAEAEELYRRALLLQPDNAIAFHLRARIAQEEGKYERALRLADSALELQPTFIDALSNRAHVLHQLGRYEEALESADRALAIDPGYVDALMNRCNALEALRRYEEALAAYDRLLEARPGVSEALQNRGHVFQELRRHEEALASYEAALALRPDFVQALSNRGSALRELGRYDEALASLGEALRLDPRSVDALNNRGSVLQQMKRHGEALEDFRLAQGIDPEDGRAHWNEALCLLALGDYEPGWKKYEWRWKSEATRRDFPQPLWLGNGSLAGKTILLHAEQGFGDTIQFVRYVDLVARRGAAIVLEIQRELRTLLDEVFPAHQVRARGEPLPAFDCHCPLLSLPLAFGTRLETLPASVPYLAASASRMDKWADRLGRLDGMRVGIAWSSQPMPPRRSAPLTKFLALRRTGVALVSLQRHVREEDAAVLGSQPGITHLGAQLEDFADTAAVIAHLDLVITVDTAVAHLAGAMGKPVWILLPFSADWRWLTDRQDSPWYPTARLFRQAKFGDWDGVLTEVTSALSSWEPR